MHVTLKTMEKLDDLLDEADEYVTCATAHADDHDLKSAYLDLARCHYDGYEKLAKIAERSVERKASAGGEKAQVVREMAQWHLDKFADRASKIKMRLDQVR